MADRNRRDEYDDMDDVGTRLAKHSSGSRASLAIPEGLVMFRPNKTGAMTINVVPYVVTKNVLKFNPQYTYTAPGKRYSERTFFVHGGVGVNNESFTCPAQTFRQACPICEARKPLQDSPHKEDKDRSYELKPKERQVFLIYNSEDADRGIQLWEVANWNFGRHLDRFIEGARPQDKQTFRRYAHPVEGLEIRVVPTEVAIGGGDKGGSRKSGTNTEFVVQGLYPRSRPLPDSVINHGFDLDAIVRVLDYADLKNVFTGRTEDEDDTDPDPDTGGPTDHAYVPRGPGGDRDDRQDRAERTEAPSRNGNDRDRDEAPTRRDPVAESRPAVVQDDPDHQFDPFGSGDTVEQKVNGKWVQGKVESVKRENRTIKVVWPGSPRAIITDYDEVRLVKSDDTFDLPSAVGGDDGDAEPAPRPAKESASAPRTRASEWDDEDDGRTVDPPAAAPKPRGRPPKAK